MEGIDPLNPNEIARRYGRKPGYRLIDSAQVALPVFSVPIDAVVVASKPIPLNRRVPAEINFRGHQYASGFVRVFGNRRCIRKKAAG